LPVKGDAGKSRNAISCLTPAAKTKTIKGEDKMIKIIILTVLMLVAVVVYQRTVSTCPSFARPFPSHTFEYKESEVK
jgi:hypothetical protein